MDQLKTTDWCQTASSRRFPYEKEVTELIFINILVSNVVNNQAELGVRIEIK
jgi:hypothetical protein